MLSRRALNRTSAIWAVLLEFADASITASASQPIPEQFRRSAERAIVANDSGDAHRTLAQAQLNAARAASWLKSRFGLAHAEASALAHFVTHQAGRGDSIDEKLDILFRGVRKVWRQPTLSLCRRIEELGQDAEAKPNHSYINLRRGSRRFGLIQIYAGKVNVGVNLRGVRPNGRLQLAGSWNTMVTHVIAATDADSFDSELMSWVAEAYARAK